VGRHYKHLGGNVEGGDPNTFYPALWEWMVKELGVKSVLDVGCGQGYALREFKRLGCEAFGIDGLPENVADCGGLAVVHDLTTGPYRCERVDLVWCCELVEHVEDKFLANLLGTLSGGRLVAMTHALPGQIGYYHVNCRAPDYWVEKMDEAGYVLRRDLTDKSRGLAHSYWNSTGLIFEELA